MAQRFDDWEGQHLEHFGTKGMRWGQRRFQNEDGSLTTLGKERYGKGGKRGALGRSMDLNKLDRETTRANYEAKRLESKAAARYSRQKYKAKKKNPSAKISKDEKTQKWEKKASDYKKLSEKSKQMAQRIIQDSLKKKMSVRSKDTLRQVNVGRDLAKSVGISSLLPGIYNQTTLAKGTHYRVKNDGVGQRIHKKKRSVDRNVGRTHSFVGVY